MDLIIVGNYVGSNALAAVGSSGAIINLLIGFCIGASTGAGVVISQFYGAKNTEGVRKAVHTTMAIVLVAGVLLTVIGITVTPSMLRLMGTPDKVFEQSVIYLQVYFGGSLFSVVYNMSAGVLNAVGNSRRSLGIPDDRSDFKYIPGSDHGCRGTETWNRWRGTEQFPKILLNRIIDKDLAEGVYDSMYTDFHRNQTDIFISDMRSLFF